MATNFSTVSVIVPNSAKDPAEKMITGTVNGVPVQQKIHLNGPGFIIFDNVTNSFSFVSFPFPPNTELTLL